MIKNLNRPFYSFMHVLLSLAIILSVLPVTAWAAAGETGTTDGWKWKVLDDGTLTITGHTSPSGNLTLPGSFNTSSGPKAVTRIESNAFKGGDPIFFPSQLKTFVMPDSVTSVGDNAFNGCIKLTSVTLSSNLRTIGASAFYGCRVLTSVTMPDSMESIGSAAFSYCSGLVNVTLPDNPLFTVIPEKLFYMDGSLQTTNIADLTHLASIGSYAFSDTAIKIITLPNSVTGIGSNAFTACRSLESITLPDNPGFTTLPDDLFAECNVLKSLVIPASVTSLGDGIQFNGCYLLAGITVNTGNTAFSSADGVLYNADKTQLIRHPAGRAGQFAVPDSVTEICDYAFLDSSLLTGVSIPDSVQSIGSHAFFNCRNAALTQIDLPESIESIGDYAFNGCGSLYRINIPAKVKVIAPSTFTSCLKLRYISLPDNLEVIGDNAFFGCESLNEVTIPKNVTSIGNSAFIFSTNLRKAVILSRSTAFGSNVFNNTAIKTGSGIYAFTGSTAQTYASANVIPFHTLYTISFDSGEGSPVADIIAEAGYKLSKPTNPELPEFNFKGWYKDEEFTEAWDFDSDTVAADTVLYAKWAPVTPPAITTTSLPEGIVGTPFSTPLAAEGDMPITWSADGELPDGLTLGSGTGIISGTPSAIGTFGFTVKAENSVGSDTQDFSIVIGTKLLSVTTPAAITGVANGTAKTAAALGLPPTLTLVTGSGNMSGNVTWDVASSAYDPSSIAEQTFAVSGTVTLPGSVRNSDGVSLDVTVSVTVNAAPVTVTSVTIKTAPARTTYTVGEALDLSGLAVTLHKSNTATEDIDFADFDIKGITTNPANGTVLSVGNTSVTVTYTADGKFASQAITVNQAPAEENDAAIHPENVNYDLNAPGDVSTAITWNDASMVTDVVYGATSLAAPDVYTVTESALTIRSSYLAALGLVKGDRAAFEISFDKGGPATLTVSIVDSSEPTPVSHGITLENDGRGTANASAASASAGTEITLTALPNDGYRFKEWQVVRPAGLAINGNIFTMPDEAVTVKAVFEENPTVNYTLTVNGSYASVSGAGSYAEGAVVSINGGSRSSYTFNGWSSSDGVAFANANSASTTFTMPARNVTVTAAWSYSGGSTDGGGNNSSSAPPKPAAQNYTADIKVLDGASNNSSNTTLPITVDANTGTAALDAGSQSNLISNGSDTVITVPAIPDVDTYTLGISVAHLSTADKQGTLTVNTDRGSITIPSNMLTGVTGAETKAEVSIGQGDKTGLSEDEKAAIGDRPLISLSMAIDGKRTEWNNPAAPVTVSIPYTPTAAELLNPESILIWYIDGSGKAVPIPSGHYDPATGTVTFATTHFSCYAVGYNKVSFADVAANAWYGKAVGFIAARGITTGTGNGNYSPDARLTRGEFLVMLMKAYGIAPDENQLNNFTDAGSTYYTGYLAAAKKSGITGGVGNNMYAPNKEISRQEMFTLSYNVLKSIHRLPQGDSRMKLSDFSDAGQLASWAKDAMSLLVETGTIGGNAGKLNPTDTTSRAEMAQMLYSLLFK